jgi:hypothetical protein
LKNNVISLNSDSKYMNLVRRFRSFFWLGCTVLLSFTKTAFSATAPFQVKTDSRFNRLYRGILGSAGIVACLLVPTLASAAATAPALLTNAAYGVVSTTWNDTSSTPVTGSGCTTSLSGTPTVTTGTAPPTPDVPCTPQQGLDQGTALATLTGQTCTSLGGGAVALDTVNLGSGAGVFTPGCYSTGGGMSIGANITLNGPGVYVFRSSGTFTSSNTTTVFMTGGACESDVFWAPGAATTLGANTVFKGSILDGVGNAITVGSTTNIVGRLLSFGGVVTTDTDVIAIPTCVTVYPSASVSVPTLSEWAIYTIGILIALMAMFGIAKQRRHQV